MKTTKRARDERMVRVSSKGQVVLPKRMRERAGIYEGDYIMVRESSNGDIVIRKSGAKRLEEITAGLREEVQKQGFTREQLDELIDEVRAELWGSA